MEDLEVFYSVYGLYLWAGLAALVLLLGLWLLALQIRISRIGDSYRFLMDGVEEANLEEVLERQVAYLQETSGKLDGLATEIEQTERELRLAIQRIGLVRFNPFGDTGGDQSFAIALLDAQGDGVVLTSLFSRAANRVFAKPVKAGASTYALSEEEKQAIELAVQRTATPA